MMSNSDKETMNQNGRSIFYHRTTPKNAHSIVASGFTNGAGHFLNNRTWTGVWLSSKPLDNAFESGGDALLMVKLDIPERQLARWEWTTEGRSDRGWLIPASLVNSCMTIEMVDRLDLLPVAA